MTKEQVEALARVVAGPAQVYGSISLQMGGHHADNARQVFALRDAFGVQSYASVEEAEAQIRASMGEKICVD